MMELPEAIVTAVQLNATVYGKTVSAVTAASSPHKFAWFSGDPAEYPALLTGKKLGTAVSFGAYVQIPAEGLSLVLGEGIGVRYCAPGEKTPVKHQLFLRFTDGSALVCSVRMYGGMWLFPEGTNENQYYVSARDALPPLDSRYTLDCFLSLRTEKTSGLSAKAFLATEQRIPGLGNGVLQDILFRAGLHPKRKMETLSGADWERLYSSLKTVLREMTDGGGRDTEPDIFGNPGAYVTILSRNTAGMPCRVCGSLIRKETFLGGSIYYCPVCQK